MTAVLTSSTVDLPARPARRSASASSDVAHAAGAAVTPPRLRLIEGGRSDRARARRRVYLRRRIIAAVVALAVCIALVVALASLVERVGTSVVPAAGSPSVEVPSEVVVAPGDSLWGISAELGLPVDTRVIVAELSAANGGAEIQPGQRLVIPDVVRAMA